MTTNFHETAQECLQLPSTGPDLHLTPTNAGHAGAPAPGGQERRRPAPHGSQPPAPGGGAEHRRRPAPTPGSTSGGASAQALSPAGVVAGGRRILEELLQAIHRTIAGAVGRADGRQPSGQVLGAATLLVVGRPV